MHNRAVRSCLSGDRAFGRHCALVYFSEPINLGDYLKPFETSTLELLAESRLPLTSEALLERRLCRLVSLGSFGLRPLARAKRFRTSVKETTPDKRPDI